MNTITSNTNTNIYQSKLFIKSTLYFRPKVSIAESDIYLVNKETLSINTTVLVNYIQAISISVYNYRLCVGEINILAQ